MNVVQVYGGPVFATLGGHEYLVRRLSEELSKLDLNIKVLCPGFGISVVCHESKLVKYIEIPSYDLTPRIRFPKLSFLRFIIQHLRTADVVHAHCPDNPFVFFLTLISRLLNKPLIVTVLAYADDFKHHDKIKRISGLFTAAEQTIAIWISDKLHVESLYDANKLLMYKNKLVMIPPGVEDHILTSKSSIEVQRLLESKIRQKKGEKIILYLGRIHKAKGLNHAVTAVAFLKKAQHKVKLVVAGRGNSFLKEIERSIVDLGLSNEFIYLGKVTDEEKIALLDLANVVVVPSLSDVVEAYSIVASEAWARKKLVVAYAVGALKYRVKNGENGFLAKARHPKELANAMTLALSRSMNCETPSDVWSWNEAVNEFKQAYEDIVKLRLQ